MAYTDEQKAEALGIYATEGMAAAHAATGIPKGTIGTWAKAQNVPAPERSDEQTKAATEAHVERMAAKRWATRNDLADTVQVLLQDVRDEDSATKRQALAISVGIFIDKLAIVGWGDGEAAGPTGNPDLERLREEGRKRGQHLVAV